MARAARLARAEREGVERHHDGLHDVPDDLAARDADVSVRCGDADGDPRRDRRGRMRSLPRRSPSARLRAARLRDLRALPHDSKL